MTDVGGLLRFVGLTLKVVIQNEGDFVDVILLYTEIFFNEFRVTRLMGTRSPYSVARCLA